MTEPSPGLPEHQPQSESATVDVQDLLQLLRRKERNWVEWGRACQQLQKAGYSDQKIFEETGFEPIQQNQVIVASQVYTTMVNAGVSEAVRSRFERTGSDSLYELRILTQAERATAAEYIVARNLDSEGAREVAKALKDFSRLSSRPKEFSNHPGDAVAYQYWKVARQHNDLQERSRLIARGLMFAHSQEARQQIEQLLTDAFGGKSRQSPRLPFYRLELDEGLPRMITVVGQLPLTATDLKEAASVETTGAFHLAQASQNQTLVTVPGWQVIAKAQDPVGILCKSNQLPGEEVGKSGEVLVIIDRVQQEWDADSYFAIDRSGQLALEWFPDNPNIPLLGRVILALRPRKILDEPLSRDLWQIDE